MLASSSRRLLVSKTFTRRSQFLRVQSTKATTSVDTSGPIAEDGRHEVWREGIYDHDNEPK